jgi:hypothetical protein
MHAQGMKRYVANQVVESILAAAAIGTAPGRDHRARIQCDVGNHRLALANGVQVD